jgi:galactosamine-6-phosphate isomerase
MAAQIAEKPDSILCLATGGSPREAYRIFAHIVLETGLDLSRAVFVKLDEWHGIPMDNPATCESFLQRELFRPLSVHSGSILSFDSMAEKPEAECRRIADALDAMGPLDLTILGIGRNGHLGLNEPSGFLMSRPHVAVLAEKTLGHAMLKEAGATVSRGMTLGMADLLKSRHIVMMVAGEGKEEASAGMLSGKVTTTNPSSFLQLASKVTVLSAMGNMDV